MYTNGHDDYGKKDMTLRKLLDHIKRDIFECETKDDLIGVLSMIYNGDLDGEIVPNSEDMLINGIEYTGLDPVLYTPRIERLFNRQVIIIGELFSQRFCEIGVIDGVSVNITRRYFLNSKKITCDLPFPLTIEDQNWIQLYY